MNWSGYRRKKKTRVAPKARTKAEKCKSKWCKNRRATKRSRYRTASGKVGVYECTLPYCWKCKARHLAERHPHTYVLNMLRHSARKRNLPFTLTLDQFKAFCAKTNYLELRGKNPSSLTVDRIDRTDGYHHWNIQIMTHADNSAQGSDNTPREEAQERWETSSEPSDTGNNPF